MPGETVGEIKMNDLRRMLQSSLKLGLIVGIVALYLSLIGFIEGFNEQAVVSQIISLGKSVLLLMPVVAGYVAMRVSKRTSYGAAAIVGGLAGLVVAVMLVAYLLISSTVNLRSVFVNATDGLAQLLTLGLELGPGSLLLLAVGLGLGALGGLTYAIPSQVRRPVVLGLATVLTLSILQELFTSILANLGLPESVIRFLFARQGLTIAGAIFFWGLVAGLTVGWPRLQPRLAGRLDTMNPAQRNGLRFTVTLLGVGILFFVPRLVGLYWSDVLDNVLIYALMGLGLNIVVGYAGLLDLGYVAFFAIGAYTAGLLTSINPAAWLGTQWSFWAAWPVALLVAATAGILLGIPVLRMRGDYLAIVTLGFGEIIRILALSDLLKPYIGGAQGILQIPKPAIAGQQLITSQQLYYLILIGIFIAIFVSFRLSDSRIGRAWIAVREDEDVAQAMGINLVKYKLMAFAIGATFSGMSGAIFASKLSSIFPHSFNLLISINVLSLIIVGGMASIPGVIVGALVLVGLPEVLRFAAEYRLLFYGAMLVIMMLVRPEGFWPAARRRRELREEALAET